MSLSHQRLARDVRKLRVLVLMHKEAVPPENIEKLSKKEFEDFKTEYDIMTTLQDLGHEVHTLGLVDELAPIRNAIEEVKPHIAFNMLEAFRGEVIYDQHVVSYLELMKIPYTGCNPRGLTLARDKALSKKILAYHRIAIPDFAVFPVGRKIRRPKRLQFPLFVKSLVEDASFGISQASLVTNDEKLEERVDFIHQQIGTDAIAETFIEGRELYVPVIGNIRLQVLPVWELVAKKLSPDEPLIATEKAKFDLEYQKRHGITHDRAKELPDGMQKRIDRTSRRIYRALGLSGYGRMDFRLNGDGKLYFLEANPNPEIAQDEEVACSAEAVGISYEQLVQKIINLGLRRAVARN